MPFGMRKGFGRGQNMTQRGPVGSPTCVCPKCGYTTPHTRGIPCSTEKCPKCQTQMRGVNCL